VKQLRDFNDDLRHAKRMGLSKKLLEQLAKEGPSALPELRNILAGGKGGIDKLDDLEKQIVKYSDKLARTGTDIKYNQKISSDVASGMAPQISRVVAAIRNQKQDIHITLDVPVKVDGKTIARVNQTYTLQHAGRNISSGLKLPNRGA
jgi:hypothetical protein